MDAKQKTEEEALALVESAARLSDEERAPLFAAFAARSGAHEEALQWAQRYLRLLSQAGKPRFSEHDMRRIRRQANIARLAEPSRWVPVVAALALLATFLVTRSLPRAPTAPQPLAGATEKLEIAYETGRAHRQVSLEDGSTLWLDWHSRVVVGLDDDARRISLSRGRAAFSVAADAQRPFIVTAGGLTTRVTGTQFEVDLRGQNGPAVGVVEGSVKVSFESQAVTLGARGQVQLRQRVLERSQDPFGDQVASWRDGRLVLREVSLSEAIAALQPYSRFTVDMSRIEHISARVSGTYFADRADDGLLGLAQTHRLVVEQRGQTLVLKPGRPTRASLTR